jgi:cation diffusion facilitator family transporter
MHDATVRDLDLGHAEPRSLTRSEGRVRVVVGLTAAMMFAEIGAGLASHSKALEADGWHMGTHAGAIGLAALAYAYGRSRATDERFSFGAGKVHALAAWTNAVLLLGAAVWMISASAWRLAVPVQIDVWEALPIAILGLLVNVVSAWLLKPEDLPPGLHGHDHAHDHGHAHDHAAPAAKKDVDPHAHDLNRRGAYLHVLMDMVTSVTAIVALIGVWAKGWLFLDPLMGLVGGAMVLRWGVGLLKAAGAQLLDVSPPGAEMSRVRARLEEIDDVRVADLHVWELGFGRRACMATVVTHSPREPRVYRAAIREVIAVEHLTVEVHPCDNC